MTSSTKLFTKMLKTSAQGTLRAATLTGPTTSTTTTSRPKQSLASDNEDNEDQRALRPAAAAAATTITITFTATNDASGNNKKRDESRTACSLRKLEGSMNYVRS
jgi:hypothetical protein